MNKAESYFMLCSTTFDMMLLLKVSLSIPDSHWLPEAVTSDMTSGWNPENWLRTSPAVLLSHIHNTVGGFRTQTRSQHHQILVQARGGAAGCSSRVEQPGGAAGWSSRVEQPGGAAGWSSRVQTDAGSDVLTPLHRSHDHVYSSRHCCRLLSPQTL